VPPDVPPPPVNPAPPGERVLVPVAPVLPVVPVPPVVPCAPDVVPVLDWPVVRAFGLVVRMALGLLVPWPTPELAGAAPLNPVLPFALPLLAFPLALV